MSVNDAPKQHLGIGMAVAPTGPPEPRKLTLGRHV
jgi:hypothetical protein